MIIEIKQKCRFYLMVHFSNRYSIGVSGIIKNMFCAKKSTVRKTHYFAFEY